MTIIISCSPSSFSMNLGQTKTPNKLKNICNWDTASSCSALFTAAENLCQGHFTYKSSDKKGFLLSVVRFSFLNPCHCLAN